MKIILTIEHTKDVGYGHSWLESDFILNCQAFILTQLVSQSIRGRWNNIYPFYKRIDFKILHNLLRLNNKFEFY